MAGRTGGGGGRGGGYRRSPTRTRPATRRGHGGGAALMPDILAAHAQDRPDAPAVLVDAAGGAHPSATSFGELNVLINRAAHGFAALGARPRDRMVWCGPNSLEALVTIHAARKAALVAVPLSYRFNAEEMAYVIDNSDATLVVIDAEQAPLLVEVSHRLPPVRALAVLGGPAPAACPGWDDAAAAPPSPQ